MEGLELGRRNLDSYLFCLSALNLQPILHEVDRRHKCTISLKRVCVERQVGIGEHRCGLTLGSQVTGEVRNADATSSPVLSASPSVLPAIVATVRFDAPFTPYRTALAGKERAGVAVRVGVGVRK